MVNIISKRLLRKNKWLIHYEHTCSCGCTTERGSLVIEQSKEPSDTLIKKTIDENHDK